MTILTRNHQKLTETVRQHITDDSVVNHLSFYWNPETRKGCHIGCLAHSDNPQYIEDEYGIPITLTRIQECIFERLSQPEAVDFFAAFPAAVGRDGKDLTKVVWKFLVAILKTLPPQKEEIQEVIDPVIAGLELLAQGKEWAAADARAAADAAGACCDYWSAEDARSAYCAAYCAARSARSAARAAYCAARAACSAYWAADAAVWAAPDHTEAICWQRDTLLRLIREA